MEQMSVDNVYSKYLVHKKVSNGKQFIPVYR